MNDSKRVWAWVGVVVVVLLIVVAIVWRPSQQQPATTSGPTPVYAPQGQLVPQFPKNLILDSNATVSGSYSINYASSTNQYTAEYNSSSTMSALFGQYQTYLPNNGWTLVGTITSDPTYEELSAYQGGSQLQVVVSKVGKGSQVTISYAIN